ncbi:MAG: 2-dehydropantoate 2-reductase [Candidatus Hydrogenedentota bacterium]|nr:MAG: 2-dehydropantoate 2-reductase [Candidatus Hydrogenedentota bacterium]
MKFETVEKTVAVIGAGAVGLLYGSRLQKAGLKVQYQSRTMAGIRKLEVDSIWGKEDMEVEIFDSPTKMSPADIILITVKALPEIDYNSLIRPVWKASSVLVLLQNGIGNDEKIHSLFPSNPLIGGLAFVCVFRDQQAIHHLDYGRLVLAPYGKEKSIAKELADIFESVSVPVEVSENLRKARWQKLFWNIPFNPLSVILQASTEEMMNSKHAVQLCRDLMQETKQIANAEGHSISDDFIEDMLDKTRKMKPYKTSMLLDFENHRPMEVEAILGEPLRIANRQNIHAPKMETIYHQLSFLEERNSKMKG